MLLRNLTEWLKNIEKRRQQPNGKYLNFKREKKITFMTKTNLIEWIFNILHIYTYDTRMR